MQHYTAPDGEIKRDYDRDEIIHLLYEVIHTSFHSLFVS